MSLICKQKLHKKDDLPANINQNLCRIRIDENQISPFYLLAYLNSRIGRKNLWHLSRQTEQVNLNCVEVGNMEIVRFSDKFEKQVEQIVKTSECHRLSSKSLYQEANTVLDKWFAISNCESDNSASIRKLKESFLQTGRLDAEYYQPKYETLENAIKSYRNGYASFGEVYQLRDKNVTPDPDQEYCYIELANVGNQGEITDVTVALGKELPSRARRMVHTNDVILSSIEGSMSSIALIPEEYDQALCSTGFYVAHSELLRPETTLILFQSMLMQDLLKRGCSGTILTNLNKEDLANIPVPILEKSAQDEISSYVQKSMSYRKQAKDLLKLATDCVELAIDKSEADAITMLTDRQTDRQTDADCCL